MEEKNITPQESLEIISRMIESTKRRFRLSDGNTLLMWGYLSVAVCVITLCAVIYAQNNMWNFLWFLIPAIGVPCSIIMDKRAEIKCGTKTYLEGLSSRLWGFLGLAQLVVAIVCTVFMFKGINIWLLMGLMSFVLVGFAASVFGMIIKENSMILGGFLSFASGIALTGCRMAGVPITNLAFAILFIAAFAVMFIIPGHILNHKVKTASK
ncbi:MAG: hypothetical protein HUJ89_04490 [Bacteroidales bacterium]|nr:hypothetical protein [Bacteroidales bacterium]